MGMYDTLEGVPEGYDSQLKCWDCTMAEFKLGDEVSPVGIATTYSIQLGGEKLAPMFILVEELKIKVIGAPDPLTGAPVFDKWARYVGHGGMHLERPEHPIKTALNEALMSPWTVQKNSEVKAPVKAPPKQERKEPTVPIVTHQLRLRERFGVHLKLPTDLTENEAERIAAWVRALPISRNSL
jgi:hypothetical protein